MIAHIPGLDVLAWWASSFLTLVVGLLGLAVVGIARLIRGAPSPRPLPFVPPLVCVLVGLAGGVVSVVADGHTSVGDALGAAWMVPPILGGLGWLAAWAMRGPGRAPQ